MKKGYIKKIIACSLSVIVFFSCLISVPVNALDYGGMYQNVLDYLSNNLTNVPVGFDTEYQEAFTAIYEGMNTALLQDTTAVSGSEYPFFYVTYPYRTSTSPLTYQCTIAYIESPITYERGTYNNIYSDHSFTQRAQFRVISYQPQHNPPVYVAGSSGASTFNGGSCYYCVGRFTGSSFNRVAQDAIWYSNFDCLDSDGNSLLSSTPDTPMVFEKQDIPEFNLPDYTAPVFSEYVDIDTIKSSITGLDVVGAAQGILDALGGGFRYIVNSVLTVVQYLSLTLTALFSWLKDTLPVLFNNMLVDLQPLFTGISDGFSNIQAGISESSLGNLFTTVTGKIDNLISGITGLLPETFSEIFTALPTKLKEITDNIIALPSGISSLIEELLDDVKTKIDNTITFVTAIRDKLLSLPEDIISNLRSQFIPETGYFSRKFLTFQSDFYDDFPVILTITNYFSDIDSSKNNVREAPEIIFPCDSLAGSVFTYVIDNKNYSVELFNGCENIVVSFSFFDSVLPLTDLIIVSVCYALTIIYSIKAIPNIIGGIGSASSTIQNSYSNGVKK